MVPTRPLDPRHGKHYRPHPILDFSPLRATQLLKRVRLMNYSFRIEGVYV